MEKIQIEMNELVIFTYGDSLVDIDLNNLINFALDANQPAIVTAVKPPMNYGFLKIRNNIVESFDEKRTPESSFISAGFFVLNRSKIFEYYSPSVDFEKSVLPILSSRNELGAFIHLGNWAPMDNIFDKFKLDKLWKSGEAFWKNW